MVNHLCSFRKLLVPLLILVGLLRFGYFFSIFVTSTILLVLSTIFFTFSKPKAVDPIENENPISGKNHVLVSPDQKIPVPHSENHVKEAHKYEKETTPQMKEAQEHHQEISSHSASSHDSPDPLSESECPDHSSTTEDSEPEWPFREIATGRKTAVFSDDGSISDEESLIEIALPSGHYVGHDNKEQVLFNLNQKKMPADHLFPECIFKQRSLMDLLAEINDMNEEENLIEIDISMGSIKCSRFEIEA